MINSLLLLFGSILAVKYMWDGRERQLRAANLFLLLLSVHFLLAYPVLMCIYIFNLAELYPHVVSIDLYDRSLVLLNIIPIGFVFLGKLSERNNLTVITVSKKNSKLPKLSRVRLMLVAAICLFVYFLAVKFRTLGVGAGVNVILPFRLNGIIESICLYFIPILMVLYGGKNRAYYVLFYCILNLMIFGSKGAAIIPLVIYVLLTLAVREEKLSLGFIVVAIFPVLLYSLVNPYYLSVVLKSENSFGDALGVYLREPEVIFTLFNSQNIGESFFAGVRNLCERLSGLPSYLWSVDYTFRLDVFDFKTPTDFNIEYINPVAGSYSPGGVGFFVLISSSAIAGVFLYLIFLFLLVSLMNAWEEKSKISFSNQIILVVAVINIIGVVLEGTFFNESHYLKMIFTCFIIFYLLRFIPLGEKYKVDFVRR